MLQGWDGDVSAASPAAAIFEAWFLQLTEAITGDELGPARDGQRTPADSAS